MGGAPEGAIVTLYLDTRRTVDEGDIVQSLSGRSYRIITSRPQTRGNHIGRHHLKALVINPETITDDDRIIRFAWYPRPRK